MTGTTIETAIRIMSRWGKQDVVHTEKEKGPCCSNRRLLESLGNE